MYGILLEMSEYFEFADPSHIKREREKSREMKKSNWWKQQLGRGVCYHCEKKFSKDQLTMDHLVPLSRGGKTTKQNVVVSCQECNATKKHFTRAEMVMNAMAQSAGDDQRNTTSSESPQDNPTQSSDTED